MDTTTVPQAATELLPLPVNPDTLIRRADVARYIPIQPQTLARWACEGKGPRFVKLGRRLVAYRVGDLRDWLSTQTRQNTTA